MQSTAYESVAMSKFAETIYRNKYAHQVNGRKETWDETAHRVAHGVMAAYMPDMVGRMEHLIRTRKVMPGGRYLYGVGKRYPQINNCFLFKAEDSREGWGKLFDSTANALMTGGGIGVVYSDIRPEGVPTNGMGGHATGPISCGGIVNEQGRRIMQGGSRRSAIWFGLHWWHPDIFKFIACKDWPDAVKMLKEEDFNFPADLDMTNISVILDDEFFEAYSTPGWSKTYRHESYSHTVSHEWAHDVYWASVRNMLKTGEPGFSVDIGENCGENLRNACTEVSSRDNGDMCNLASINMARVNSPEQFHECVEVTTAFLLCGTLMSRLPVEYMYRVRERNRRLGLGLMGMHEWMLQRGQRYGPSDELADWMAVYALSGAIANRWADRLGISRPVATRSIAPTGTISIVAETTSGIEPLPYVAYKRRYLDGKTWKAQYVVDSHARRLVEAGVDPDLIEDSVTLAEDVERRMSFQAWLQRHVDHGISSTINLPAWGSSLNNESTVTKFGNTLLRYLPELRGITAYPDGARPGQPLTKHPYWDAISREGVEFVDSGEEAGACKNGVCGG